MAPGEGREQSPLLEMLRVTKTFPRVRANDRVTFNVMPGEIHALLGENGAGKTTLMNVLYGLYQPDEGEIRIHGKAAAFESPRDAIRLGVGMVHQHFTLVPTLSVAENIALGLSGSRGPLLKLKDITERVRKLSASYSLDVEPAAQVSELSLGQQQRVEILKSLFRGAALLVMDEPTSVLTPGEVRDLFVVLRQIRDEGRAVIFISHKLEEILEISDRVTVLRDGRVVGTTSTSDADEKTLARMMVGREISRTFDKRPSTAGQPVLEVNDLHVTGHPGLRGVSFSVSEGEILGIAGVDGNGQMELSRAIGGLIGPADGDIRINGESVAGLSVRDRKNRKLAYVPEDRRNMGLVLEFTVAENLVLRDIREPPFAKRGLMDLGQVESRATQLRRTYDIRTPSVKTRVRQLSGGNQQRVVLAREISGKPDLLLVVHPTLGLDVGAMEYVMKSMLRLREEGVAILYISSELAEIFALSDRIGVLFQGELIGVVPRESADIEHIGLMMAGRKNARADHV